MTVRDLREMTGLCQSRFAERYGLEVGTLRAWERDARSCPAYVVNMLSKLVARDVGDYGMRMPAEPLYRFDEEGIQDACENYSSRNAVVLREALVSMFGEGDVVSGYRSSRYPFPCSFYIKSRDLYIEQHDFKQHGGHWYDRTNPADQAIYGMWSAFADFDDSYISCCEIWEAVDTAKRWYAANACLNYVVFWDDDLTDAVLWFDLGCPDGQDWRREYSWVPDTRDGMPDNLYSNRMTDAFGIVASANHAIRFGC